MSDISDITDILNNKLPKNTPKQVTPALIFGQLFQSADVIHLVHLNTRGYAEHKELEVYYTKARLLVDRFVEIYQGSLKGGRVNIIIPSTEYCEPIQHFTTLKHYIQTHRHIAFSESHHQSIIDDIIELIDKTVYSLTLS